VLAGYASDDHNYARPKQADELLLKRKETAQHLICGSGIHRRVGAILSRMDIEVLMRPIFARLDGPTLGMSMRFPATRPAW